MAQIDDLIQIIKKNDGRLNEIAITILEDGTIKVETGSFTGPVHAQASRFLNETEKLMGGQQIQEKKLHRRTHTHTHIHQGQGNGGHSHSH